MYSKKENILQLVSLLKQNKVLHIVVSPGSRNMPLAESFYNDSDFKCYAVTDERSAGFFAIGLILNLNCPVAICCTSGSALLNYGSAISEAFYQELPLLILSADRPQAWIGQMDGQTMQQTQLFGNMLAKEVNLPIIKSEEDSWFCNRLINEALLALFSPKKSPVHINIPIDEPFFDCSATTLPVARCIHRNRNIENDWNCASKPLVIVGQMHPNDTELLSNCLSALNCPILSENIGNLRSTKNNIPLFDAILLNSNEALNPDLVIYIGGHIVSKRLKQWLRNCHPKQCWRIAPSGDVADTFQSLTDIFDTNPSDFIKNLTPKKTDNEYLSLWRNLNSALLKKIDYYDYSSNLTLFAIKELIQSVPSQSALFLANSNTIRHSQFFINKELNFFCNRGINGIDGSLSAAVGYACNYDHLTFLIIGDLSFFYDMNALWYQSISPNLRILLLNNNGGGIFKSLPGLNESDAVKELIITHNKVTAKGWAESVGLSYFYADDNSFTTHLLEILTAPSETPILLELNCNAENAKKEYTQFIEYLRK